MKTLTASLALLTKGSRSSKETSIQSNLGNSPGCKISVDVPNPSQKKLVLIIDKEGIRGRDT
jgi:hypothetical protein